VLIKLPLEGAGGDSQSQAQVDLGRDIVKKGLNQFGSEKDAYEIIGTDAVGAVAGAQLRNKAIAVPWRRWWASLCTLPSVLSGPTAPRR